MSLPPGHALTDASTASSSRQSDQGLIPWPTPNGCYALRDPARDLLETMQAAPGIGITAPHIGVSLRVVVLDLDPIDGARTYVNPEIIWAPPEMILHQESSVSMTGVNDDIRRHARVRISYHDVDGNPQTEESEGSARCLPPA